MNGKEGLAYRLVRGVISVLCLVVILVGVAQVFCRFILKSALPWSEELLRYAFVWITFLGAAIAAREGELAKFEFLDQVLRQKAANRTWRPLYFSVKSLVLLTSVTFCVLVLWYGRELVETHLKTGQLTPAMELPMSVVSLAIPVGAVLMLGWFVTALKEILFDRPSGKSQGDLGK
jgi:C4-dicarboxylate transporter DctQ subunit